MKKGKNVMKKPRKEPRLYTGVFFAKEKKRWVAQATYPPHTVPRQEMVGQGFNSQKAAAEALAKHRNCTLSSLRLNKKATNKNIQKKAMKDKKKKALGRLKKAAVDLKKKAPRHVKDKKNLKRPAAGDPEQASKKGPRTPILKGPLFPDVSVTAGEGYYKLFKVTCMIVPPRQGSSRRRIVVGVKNQAAGPLLFFVDGHVAGENFSQMVQRPQAPILKGPLMPDASLMPPEDIFKPFQLTCMVIPPKASSSANRLVVGVVGATNEE
jgi:hypothetical protein